MLRSTKFDPEATKPWFILYSFECTVELYVYEDSWKASASILVALGYPSPTSSEHLHYPTCNEENVPRVQTNLYMDPAHPINFFLDIYKPLYHQKLPMYSQDETTRNHQFCKVVPRFWREENQSVIWTYSQWTWEILYVLWPHNIMENRL